MMRGLLVVCIMVIVVATTNQAYANCFIAKENDKTLIQEGECEKRHSPCSTFKIAIALMGFDSGILKDEHNPVWDFKQEYSKLLSIVLDNWKQPHDPELWMKHSAVWYSQIITQKLGYDKFADYVKKLGYGNQDISAANTHQDGLTHAWLSSSLLISPLEQIALLEKLQQNALPFSQYAITKTKSILFADTLADDWKLYGKTGSGNILHMDGSRNQDRQIGWYVGWIEKGNRSITFAYFIEDNDKQDSMAGKRAKAEAIEKIKQLISHTVEH